MLILGVAHQHDAGAALIADGRIIAAVNEERLNRQKLYWGWPQLAVREVLQIADVSPADIDAVAICNTTNTTQAVGLDNFYAKDIKRRALIWLSQLGLARLICGNNLGITAYRYLNTKRWNVAQNQQQTRALQTLGIKASIHTVDHHISHQASAYYTSGWDTCLNISLDGVGDGYCSRIAV